jgi:hypothetical protein
VGSRSSCRASSCECVGEDVLEDEVREREGVREDEVREREGMRARGLVLRRATLRYFSKGEAYTIS